MIDIALFIVDPSTGAFLDGFWTVAQQVKDANLTMDALHAMAAGQLGAGGVDGLTQLDPEVISRQLELYGLGLPQEWTLAHFTGGAA